MASWEARTFQPEAGWLTALFYSYRITNSSGSLRLVYNLPSILLVYLDCSRCLGPWNSCKYLCSRKLLSLSRDFGKGLILDSAGTRKWSSQPRQELGETCVWFNTTQRVPFTCNSCFAFTNSHVCASGCNFSLPAVILPRYSAITSLWQQLKYESPRFFPHRYLMSGRHGPFT